VVTDQVKNAQVLWQGCEQLFHLVRSEGVHLALIFLNFFANQAARVFCYPAAFDCELKDTTAVV
jgi:hypothetical protein